MLKLGEMWLPSQLPRKLAACERDVHSDAAEVRASAVTDLVAHTRDAPRRRDRALALISAAVGDPAPTVRAAAAIALADAEGGRVHAAPLIAAVDDDDDEVRQLAITALGELGEPSAVTRLVRAAEDDRPSMRYQAVIALARIEDAGPEVRVKALLRASSETTTSTSATSRCASAEEHFAEDVPERLRLRAVALLADEQSDVAIAAALFLGHAGDDRAKDVLRRVVRGELPAQREDEREAVQAHRRARHARRHGRARATRVRPHAARARHLRVPRDHRPRADGPPTRGCSHPERHALAQPQTARGGHHRGDPSQARKRMNLEGVQYDEGARAHVESYFLKINDPDARRALWVKATILANERERVAEAWAIAFARGKSPIAFKTTVDLGGASFSRQAIDVAMPRFALTRAHARGDVGDVSFDVALSDDSEPLVQNRHVRMYEGPFPSSKTLTPMPNLRARGEVRVPGEDAWKVDGWRGSLGHNWGRGHAYAYAWGHCNVWNEMDDVVFEGTSARVRVGPVLLPTSTLLFVRTGGQTYALNRMRRVFFQHGAMTFRRWTFSARGPSVSVRGELWADTDDMAGLRYENPTGETTYCLNSKLASARLEVTLAGRRPLVLTSRAAALEIGTRDPNHGVRMVA